MLIVIGRAQAAPGRRDQLAAAAKAVAAASLGDDGCESYGFYADLNDDRTIVSVEIWRDRSALDAHMAHEHTRQFLAVAPDLVADEPVLTVHEVS
ncbi:putative quinol monooxygenase [Nocardia noduli]|uniref:putative quinol monooxygenase n=1 Tax=Nocardia noduli TaxID=2815722 RepID=UPI001C239684|nr:putative quinol monooxygenase [Nocardia noduli]